MEIYPVDMYSTASDPERKIRKAQKGLDLSYWIIMS